MRPASTFDSGELCAETIDGVRQDCDLGVWDNAFIHADAQGPWVSDASEAFAHGADWAARWIAGLMGMATAIHQSEVVRQLDALDDTDGTDADEPADRGFVPDSLASLEARGHMRVGPRWPR